MFSNKSGFQAVSSASKLVSGLFLTCLLLASTAQCHSFLIAPTADWTNKAQPECRIGKPDGPQFDHFEAMNCPGPCGQTGKVRNGAEFFSQSQGHTKLSRGQKLYMKWTKNNHHNGFVRFTLVPKSERMNKAIHDKFAFHYACWEAGEIGCQPGDECGTDEDRLRYQTEVEIPRIYPDGEYILGWSWYGGTMYRDGSEKAEFGDYWSCSNIQIHGSIDGNGMWQDDKNLAAEYKPVFIPGMNDRSKTTCKSAVNRLGVCATEPCYARYEGSEQVPAGFENGASPQAVRAEDIRAIVGSSDPIMPTSGNEAPKNEEPPRNVEQGGGNVKIHKLELFNTQTGQVVDYGFEGEINISSFKDTMSVQAVISNMGSAQRVEFYVGDNLVHTENQGPYWIAGDFSNGNGQHTANPWRAENNPPHNQQFKLTVKVYGNDGSMDEVSKMPIFVTV